MSPREVGEMEIQEAVDLNAYWKVQPPLHEVAAQMAGVKPSSENLTTGGEVTTAPADSQKPRYTEEQLRAIAAAVNGAAR